MSVDIVFFDNMPMRSHNPEPRIKVRGLMRRGHRVLVVDKMGMNDPSLANIGLISARLKALARRTPASSPPSGWPVTEGIMRPVLLPPRRAPVVKGINRRWLARSLKHAIEAAGMKDPLLWTRFPAPELVDIIDQLPHRGVLYECVDDYPAFLHWSDEVRALLRENERRLTQRADLVVVTAPRLGERLGPWARRLEVVPNGVDVELFMGKGVGELPSELAGRLKPPVVGFVGVLDLRLDYELLVKVARAVKPGVLLIVGPQYPKVPIEPLPQESNVVFAGEVPHEQVPLYLRHMDACLLPYDGSKELVRALSPVKLFEYLASGVPVVGVDLPAVRALDDVVRVATTHDEFVAHVLAAVAEHDPAARQARQDRALTEGWDSRLDSLDASIREVFPGPGRSAR